MQFLPVFALLTALACLPALRAAEGGGPQPKPLIAAAGVTNAAGYTAGTVSPGEIVVIFGTDIGPATLMTLATSGSFVTNTLGGVRVLFDGVAAPLIYVSATQVSAIVPYAVDGKTSTMMTLEFGGVTSGPVELPVAASVLGIFTSDSSGMGQAAALNQDGSVNSADNPASPGDIVVLFVTGEGQTAPAGQDGLIIDPAFGLPKPNLGVRAIFNRETDVLYAGAAPFLVSGVMQVNARIPIDAGVNLSTAVEVLAGAESRSQPGVTVAVAVRPKPLPPGGSADLLPATFTGNPELAAGILEDRLLPFEIRNAGGAVVLSGMVQDRASRSTVTGNLIFAPRIRDLVDPGSGAKIVEISKSGFAGADVRVGYRVDGSGEVGLPSATRSGDGDTITFEFARPFGPPDESFFPAIVTNATDRNDESTIVIRAVMTDRTAASVTIPRAQGPR